MVVRDRYLAGVAMMPFIPVISTSFREWGMRGSQRWYHQNHYQNPSAIHPPAVKMMDDLPDDLVATGALEIARTLGTMHAGRVLDVGTGKGDFITTLMEVLGDYSTFTGVDVNSERLEEGREIFEGRPVDLVEMNAAEMSFADGSFDTVCISHSLHHLERPDAVLDEMVRVLRPGGLMILQEMFCDGDQTPAQRTDAIKHHWKAWVDTLTGTYHRETYTRHEIRSAVGRLDLHDIEFLETTHSIDCLSCEDWSKCRDPLHPEFVEAAIEGLEEDLAKLDDCCDTDTRETLERKGSEIIERIRETGVTPASTMFAIGRK